MAAGSKKGQTNKSTGTKAVKAQPNTSPKKKNNKYSNKLLTESVLLIIMALCIIIFLANFGIGGIAGKGISSFFFGLLGVIAYIFPVFLFASVLFYVSNRNNSVARIKIIAAFLEIVFLCTFIQLVSGNHAKEWKFRDYYINSGSRKNGGGLFGGFLCKLFTTWFGVAGAYIFTVVLIIIAAVIISEKSFINGIKKRGRKVYDTAVKDVREYRDDINDRHRESTNRESQTRVKDTTRKKSRAEKNIKGVTFNTKVGGEEQHDTEAAYTFEKDCPPQDALVHAIDDNEYEKLCSAADFEMRHFQDEQSMPFEPVYEEHIIQPPDEPENSPDLSSVHGGEYTGNPEENLSGNTDDMNITDHNKDSRVNGDAELIKEISNANIDVEAVKKEMNIQERRPVKKYKYPPLNLLKRGEKSVKGTDARTELNATALKLQQTLATFGVKVTVTDVSRGPAVTRYEIQPEQGVKVSKIVSLADDIKLNLAAADIRIEAPIPGKAAVGIEVPNKENSGVMLGDLIADRSFKESDSRISFAAGKDIAGQIVIADIAKMPHLLIAGATGSGKSVCINTIIMSILYHAKPDEVRLIMVDPKVVELSVYNGIPHLLTPVVTDPKKAAAALNWAVSEMMKRYELFAKYAVRDMKSFNEKIENLPVTDDTEAVEKMPQIVIIVDELADLMMVASSEVEDAIVRLAQLARAAGIHLVIATQRPSVNVITGLIKANVPSRIAFSVSSGVDSRTILDMVGAEKLLGKGDMLFYPQGYQKPGRVQGAFVSDEEVTAVVEFLKSNNENPEYNESVNDHLNSPGFEESQAFGVERDQYFAEAGRFIIEKERASIGMLQRILKIGFNRAARIMDQLGEAGVVGPEEGTRPRKILMSMEEFETYLNNN